MYSFTDISAGTAAPSRPSEAICFNGTWLDDAITSYQTLYVKGREAAEAEITNFEYVTRSGGAFVRKRYPARTLTVGYQIDADTPAEYLNAFDQLNRLTEKSEAQIIFGDETDKYFTGTRVTIGEPDAGRLHVTGEMEIECEDPFKYDVKYTTVSLNSGANTYNISIPCALTVPARLSIIPTGDIVSLTIGGLSRNVRTGKTENITIKTLKTGVKYVIDGETGLITADGESKLSDVTLYDLPTLAAGTNEITFSSTTLQAEIKYKGAYI